MWTPRSGLPSGSCSFSLRNALRTRRGAMRAETSPCAVRSSTRSWNENRSSPRGPRVGWRNPARTYARTCDTERPSIFATSRAP